jgi:hypothetical protein
VTSQGRGGSLRPAANDRTSAMTDGYGSGMADQDDWTPGEVASMGSGRRIAELRDFYGARRSHWLGWPAFHHLPACRWQPRRAGERLSQLAAALVGRLILRCIGLLLTLTGPVYLESSFRVVPFGVFWIIEVPAGLS